MEEHENPAQLVYEEMFVFEIEGEYYAVPAREVDLVMKIPPITPVPNSPNSVLGIFHLRAKVVVALDLIRRMNLPRERPLAQAYVFVAHQEKNHFAFLIDRAIAVARVPEHTMLPVDPLISAHIPKQYAKGMFMFEREIHQKTKKEPSFLIQPSGAPPEPTPPPVSQFPVVVLDIALLLDQADLLSTFERAETPPSPGGTPT